MCVSMPWMGRPSFLPLPPETRINKGFADSFLQVFSRIFWKRLFWRWFLACSQFVHICRRSKGNFSLSAAPIITDFFRFHKQIISHYCDHYLRSHHPPAVSFRTGVHDPGSWLPLSSQVTALENSGHLFEQSELCPSTQAFLPAHWDRILPMLRIPNQQNPQPQLYHTEFSVQKIPICPYQLSPRSPPLAAAREVLP